MAKKKKYYGMKDGMSYSNGDYSMIKEDPSAFAYLPQNVISKKYPEMDYGSDYYEQGRAYQDKEMMKMNKQAKKQKLDRHF